MTDGLVELRWVRVAGCDYTQLHVKILRLKWRPTMNCLPFLGHKKWEAVHMWVIMILQRVSVSFEAWRTK